MVLPRHSKARLARDLAHVVRAPDAGRSETGRLLQSSGQDRSSKTQAESYTSWTTLPESYTSAPPRLRFSCGLRQSLAQSLCVVASGAFMCAARFGPGWRCRHCRSLECSCPPGETAAVAAPAALPAALPPPRPRRRRAGSAPAAPSRSCCPRWEGLARLLLIRFLHRRIRAARRGLWIAEVLLLALAGPPALPGLGVPAGTVTERALAKRPPPGP